MHLGRLASGELRYPAGAPEPVVFAARELAAYLGRICGRAPILRPAPGPGGTWIALAPPGAALPARAGAPPASAEGVAEAVGETLLVAGTRPRALLAAVYALLEAAGCRWSPHGPDEEHVPTGPEARLDPPATVVRSAFGRRAWASDLATWHHGVAERLAERLPGDLAFVDWTAKSGGTGFLFIRHPNDTRWVVPEVAAAIRLRDLDVEAGGHVLAELLPRDRFPDHPTYFPAGADGARSDLGNVCTSNREALALARERAHAATAAEGIADLHLWGLDLLGGGWCRCAACTPWTPSEQALRLCNAVAEGFPGRIVHLAYHDTLPVPRAVPPHPRVWAEFAPRERCYAHALDDADCVDNVPYRRALERHLEHFRGRVEVFEYYGDAILFGGCAVPLTDVIARDLAYYRRAGVAGLSCLVFGRYSLWAYGANVEAFALGAMGRDAQGPALYCGRRYGRAARAMVRYLRALERLMAGVATYGDLLLPPMRPEPARRVEAALTRALDEAPAVRRLLEAARGSAGDPRIAVEEPLLAYTLAVLGALRSWLRARLARPPDEGAGERALAALADARRHLGAVDPAVRGTWGTHDLPLAQAFFAAALRDGLDPRGALPLDRV